MENKLIVVAKESGLEQTKTEILLKKFTNHFGEAKSIAKDSKEIVVTSEDQSSLMLQARTNRLKLKDIRVQVEKTRKELKEQSLREGKAIDGMANIIKALIIPVEEHLEKQEKFAEIRIAERKAKRLVDRTNKLSQYVEDISLYNLNDMSDEAFDNLLISCRKAKEEQIAAEKKAEEDRKAKEEADRKEQERIRLENEKLKKEKEEQEKKLIIEREKQEAKLRKEREEKEKAIAKLEAEKKEQAKKEAEKKAEEEAIKRVEEEKKRKELLAPDKTKLIKLAGDIDSFTLPAVSSREASLVLNEVKEKLEDISLMLRNKAKTL